MKKNLMRAMAMVCAVLACAPAAACGEKGEEIDTTRTQLYVSNFNGGVGYKWLDAVIARFEADYADTEFTPGKKGVQVLKDNHKSGIEGLGPKMASAKEEVYFLENINYYNCIEEGYFLDITEMVTEPLTEFGETGSIEDKLYPAQKEFLKTSNGKYYAIPHAQSPTLITYDADLFDDNYLYFDENGEMTKQMNDEGRSAGPNKIPGDYDDGLPATYEQFFQLCEELDGLGIAPMTWSGMYSFYMTRFAKNLRADFDGAEATVAYDFNGTMSHLIDTIDADGNITYRDPVEITPENGYEVYNSASYYYTFKFFEEIYKNGYYYSKAFNEDVSHTDAQEDFILSSFTSDIKDIAMLVEGFYWVNESSAAFDEMAGMYDNAALKDRNLRVMPLPKATADHDGSLTLVDSLNQMAFISAYIDEEKKDLALTFLQYCETQRSLEEFLVTTGLTRNYNVDYSNVYDQLCPYSQSVVDLLDNCNYIMPASETKVLRQNYEALAGDYEVGLDGEKADPMIAIKNGETAVSFFQSFRTKYNADKWARMLG